MAEAVFIVLVILRDIPPLCYANASVIYLYDRVLYTPSIFACEWYTLAK